MKDLLYATTTTAQDVAQNGVIPLTTITRKPSCSCIDLVNNGLILKRVGYYRISGTITFTGSAGLSAVQVYKNGQPINALQSSITTTANVFTLPVDGIIRVYCGEQPAIITLLNTGLAITTSNISIEMEYLS